MIERCPSCGGTGRKGHPDVTCGAWIECSRCAGSGLQGEGYATAQELATLQVAAVAVGYDAERLRCMTQSLFGAVPDRLRERHVTALLVVLAELAEKESQALGWRPGNEEAEPRGV